jgi:dTDP-4-amino-4,6-dideoxygalactose transaminase
MSRDPRTLISLLKPGGRKSLADLVRRYRFDEPIYILRPSMPDLADFHRRLERIWETAWLTNDGEFHRELHSALVDYLGVEHLNLCCNGTVALLLALQAARINGGEVITTPFTFPATPHGLYWNRVRPVFCDVEETSFGLDPDGIEKLIGPDTRAILAVHLFGTPCNVEAIQMVADRHGLAVIYDAAHMMGVRYKGESILRHGDFSILSFHATKPFTTAEGGAIVSQTASTRERIDLLKNFGIADEETVIGPGINGKMSELHAAFGLSQLQGVEAEIAKRKVLTEIYRERLGEVDGISFREDSPDVRHNYSYFPVLVDPAGYGMSRDQLYATLKQFHVNSRKYFYPLCSHYSCYSSLPSARPENLPVAERLSRRILCLPLHGALSPDTVKRVCTIIAELQHDS